ncbi:hypothetical protein BVY01_00250 [bacterium I07]|nr:hypothetical protein BVY01_00250 [bacterium I07]
MTLTLLVTILVISIVTPVFAEEKEKQPVETITIQELKDHVYFLSSDYLAGRRPEDTGYEIAAQYAAAHFRAASVQPLLTTKDDTISYFQYLPLTHVQIEKEEGLTLVTDSGRSINVSQDDYNIVLVVNSITNASLIFLGFGICEPEHGWDDLTDLDLKGKVGLMITGAPFRNGKPVLPDSVHEKYKSYMGIEKKLMGSGFQDNMPAGLMVLAYKDTLPVWKFMSNDPSWSRLDYGDPQKAAEVAPFPSHFFGVIKDDLIDIFFKNQIYSPMEIKDKGFRGYRSYEMKDLKASLDYRVERTDFESKNIIGIVPGTDPSLAQEYITIGAHLDHKGPKDGQIRNGADDNASGSAGILEIAEAVAMKPCRRPIMFCLYSAEESGKLGSRHFVENSPVPLENIMVNINLDMIGRSDVAAKETRKHYVVGADEINPDLRAIIDSVNKATLAWPLDFESRRNDFSKSDHYNFHQKGIPTAMFFSGAHEDYHQPTDDPEKIDYEKMQEISQLVYEIVVELANRKKSIKP